MSTSVTEFFHQVKREKTILVALFAMLANNLQFVCIYQFGFLVYNIQYSKDAASYVSYKLAVMNLIAQLVSLPFNFLIAYLTKKGVKLWRLLLLNCLLSKISSAVFVHESKKFSNGELGPKEFGSPIQDTGFVCTIIFSLTLFQISWTLLSNSMHESSKSRAVTMLAYSLFGSVGVLIMD